MEKFMPPICWICPPDMPLIVEFYGKQARLEVVIQHLIQKMDLPHIVTWSAIGHTLGARSFNA
jgi:hypothetical protein